MDDEALYHELTLYSLEKRDPAFIHQEVVDAWAAQNASPSDKSIKLPFALIGLYLYLEKGYTGKQVQQAHMKLAKEKKEVWPRFTLPDSRGTMTITDVMRAPAGVQRDAAIMEWCKSVWQAYANVHDEVRQWARRALGVS